MQELRKTPREPRAAATSELYKHRRPQLLLRGKGPARHRAATTSELYKHRPSKRLGLLPESLPPRQGFQSRWSQPQRATRATSEVRCATFAGNLT